MAEVGASMRRTRRFRPRFLRCLRGWHETGKCSSVRVRSTKGFVLVSVAVAALSAGACRRSSEEQRREAEKATEEAEEKASQTSITSAELSRGDLGAGAGADEEARVAHERALREHAEAIVVAREEQLEYRAKLQAALDRLDMKRRDAKKRGQVHLEAIDANRELLKHDLDALDRVTDTEWASMKAKIDRDLKDHAGAGEAEGK